MVVIARHNTRMGTELNLRGGGGGGGIHRENESYHGPRLIVSVVDLEAVINFEETRQIVAEREEGDDDDSEAPSLAGTPGSGA